MRRGLSIILVLVLVLGSFPVFAETGTYGEMLFEMGLIKGDENGNLNEDATITRAEMMVVLSRMYGVEDEAMAFPLNSTFTDVATDAWYAPYVAYAQVNGWTKGNGDGTFAPMTTLTADMAATFLLRTLGYNDPADFVYDGAVAFATTLGIDVDLMFGNEGMVTRGEVFEMMFDTLHTETTDGVILGELLGVLEPLVPVVDELEVLEINVINLVEVEVVFNTELDEDSAEDIDNFDIEDHDLDADLLDDGMTVLLTMDYETDIDNRFENQEEFELEIDGVMSLDESLTLEDYVSDTLSAFDATIPMALGVELTGPDTFDVIFSEPIDEEQSDDFEVEIEDGVYGISDYEFDSEVVSVTLGTDLDEDEYEIVVSDAYDFAGFKALDKTFILEFVEDTDPAEVVVDSANETEIVLLFDEDVFFYDEDGDDAIEEELSEFFYHSYTSYTPGNEDADDIYGVDVNGDEVTLDFTDNPLPEGTVKFVIDYNANDGTVEDAWGNELESNIVMYIEIVVDDVPPEVTKVETDTDDPKTIEIYFSEALDLETGSISSSDEDDYFEFLDDDDDEVDFSADYSIDSDDDEYIITLESNEALEGKYTLEVFGLEDDSLLGNEMEDVKFIVEKEDETPPDMDITVEYIVDDDELIIYVNFDEDMATSGSYSVLDEDNYIVAGYEIDLDDDSIDLFGGADVIKITIDEDNFIDENFDSGAYDDFIAGSTVESLELGRVADEIGNKSEELYYEFDIESLEAPIVTEVKTLDDKHIEIFVDGRLSTVVASGFLITNNGTSETFASVSFSYDSDDEETTIVGTLKSDTQLNDAADLPEELELIDEKIKDNKGQYLTGLIIPDNIITDGYAPSFDEDIFEDYNEDYEMIVTDGYVYLTFDEDMTYLGSGPVYDFEVELDGDELVAGIDFIVQPTTDDSIWRLTLLDIGEDGLELEDGDTVSILVEDANYSVDQSDQENPVNDFDFEVDVVNYYGEDIYPNVVLLP